MKRGREKRAILAEPSTAVPPRKGAPQRYPHEAWAKLHSTILTIRHRMQTNAHNLESRPLTDILYEKVFFALFGPLRALGDLRHDPRGRC